MAEGFSVSAIPRRKRYRLGPNFSQRVVQNEISDMLSLPWFANPALAKDLRSLCSKTSVFSCL
jgi:hypothetical protein